MTRVTLLPYETQSENSDRTFLRAWRRQELPSWWRIFTSDANEHGKPQGKSFDRWESCTQYKESTIISHIFRHTILLIDFKHRTNVPRPTDGGGDPVGVICTSDEEELLDSKRIAHERNHWRGVSMWPRHKNGTHYYYDIAQEIHWYLNIFCCILHILRFIF